VSNRSRVYFASVVLLLLVFPAVSIGTEALRTGHPVASMLLIGKWYVFWAVGVRLFIAGVRQALQPAFTAVEIFEIDDPRALAIVREIGFGNLAMGLLGLLSMWRQDWRLPAGIAGGLYYGLAGVMHLTQPRRNANERIATISDCVASVVLLGFVAASVRG
jgi:hypothetical protein